MKWKSLFLLMLIFVILSFCRSGIAQTHDKQDSIYLIKLNIAIENSFQENNIDQAIIYALDTKDLTEKTFGKKSVYYLRILNDLGALLSSKGETEKRINFYKEALFYCEQLYGRDHLTYAMIARNLGNLYSSLYNFDLADLLLTQVKEICYKKFGKNHPEYAEILNDLGVLNVRKKNHQEAENFYKEALLINEKNFGKHTLDYASVLNNLGYLYGDLGNYLAAITCYKEVLEIRKFFLDIRHPEYANSLSNLATIYLKTGSYLDAEILLKEGLEIRKKVVGENHPNYAKSLNDLAFLYQTMGNSKAAESLYKEELRIIKLIKGDSSLEYANCLRDLSMLYIEIETYEKAEILLLQESLILKNTIGTETIGYIDCIKKLALVYKIRDKYNLSIDLFKKALDIQKKIIGKEDIDYANTLNHIGTIYNKKGEYSNAEAFLKESLLIRKRVLNPKDEDLGMSLNDLGVFYSEIYNYEAALPLLNEASEIIKNKYGVNHKKYATNLGNLAVLYDKMGKIDTAELFYKKSLEITKKLVGTNNSEYAIGLHNLGTFYSEIENLAIAKNLIEEALSIRKNIYGENSIPYANTLNTLSTIHQDLNNYKVAESLNTEALKIIKGITGGNNPDYCEILHNLAMHFTERGELENAEKLYLELLPIKKQIYGTESIDYNVSMIGWGQVHLLLKNYDLAELIFTEASSSLQKEYGTYNAEYLWALSEIGYVNIEKKNYALAEIKLRIVISNTNNIYGTHSKNYTTTLVNLLSMYYISNDISKWKKLSDTAIDTENQNQQIFLHKLSESEKENYLQSNNYMNQAFLSMLHFFKSNNTGKFYQYTNSKQGSLLFGKQQLNAFAIGSKNSFIQSNYKKWQNTNAMYTRTIQLSIDKRKLAGINTDSLLEQSQQLEKKLIEQLPALQSLLVTDGITTKQVTQKLQPKEAVVHWVSFQYKSPAAWTDSVLYAAYIITPTDTAPKFVTVFEEKQLQQLLRNYYSGNGRSTIKKDSSISSDYIALYNLIWKPLLPYLKGATTVYNLPSGLLHKISFAALTDSSNQQLIDKYDIHQLLSINELVNPLKISTPAKTIALMGGANYDATTNTSQTNTVATPPMYRNASNNSTVHFNYLQGTKTEVETVAANAKATTWKVQTYTNTNASEDNFKLLSGENAPKILHIATHGFYFPPTKTKPNNFITEDKNAPKDFPLLRSGLVLSGANNFWGKDTLLENKEDGIVTAQEISTMNLLNTDLVVLSACQTALGDINGSEGVYGLQRAFKMAGVKKLLMSLWEVPDAETAELMQLFYTNVFKGDSYYNSFRKAQLAMKAKYKDPTKWAGFVLVGE